MGRGAPRGDPDCMWWAGRRKGSLVVAKDVLCAIDPRSTSCWKPKSAVLAESRYCAVNARHALRRTHESHPIGDYDMLNNPRPHNWSTARTCHVLTLVCLFVALSFSGRFVLCFVCGHSVWTCGGDVPFRSRGRSVLFGVRVAAVSVVCPVSKAPW